MSGLLKEEFARENLKFYVLCNLASVSVRLSLQVQLVVPLEVSFKGTLHPFLRNRIANGTSNDIQSSFEDLFGIVEEVLISALS